MKIEPQSAVQNCDTVIKDNGSVNIAPIHRLHYNSERIVFQEVLKNILISDYIPFKSYSSERFQSIKSEVLKYQFDTLGFIFLPPLEKVHIFIYKTKSQYNIPSLNLIIFKKMSKLYLTNDTIGDILYHR